MHNSEKHRLEECGGDGHVEEAGRVAGLVAEGQVAHVVQRQLQHGRPAVRVCVRRRKQRRTHLVSRFQGILPIRPAVLPPGLELLMSTALLA